MSKSFSNFRWTFVVCAHEYRFCDLKGGQSYLMISTLGCAWVPHFRRLSSSRWSGILSSAILFVFCRMSTAMVFFFLTGSVSVLELH